MWQEQEQEERDGGKALGAQVQVRGEATPAGPAGQWECDLPSTAQQEVTQDLKRTQGGGGRAVPETPDG